MQNPTPNFRQSSVVFEKPGILSEKSKVLTSSNYHKLRYFLLKFAHFSRLLMYSKGCLGFFFILDLEFLQKLKKPGVPKLIETRFFTSLLTTEDQNKMKKNPDDPFVDIVK